MRLRFLLFLTLIILTSSKVWSQTFESAGAIPFRIKSYGFQKGTMQSYLQQPAIGGGIYKGKTSVMVVAGGWMHMDISGREGDPKTIVRAGKTEGAGPSKYYYRVFDEHEQEVTGKTVSMQQPDANKKNAIIRKEGLILDTAMRTGTHLRVNFYDSRTDTLVSSQYLVRVKLPLEIKSYRVYKGGEVINELDTSGFIPFTGKIKAVSPGSAINIVFKKPPEMLDNLLLDYQLRGDIPGEKVAGNGKNKVTIQNLKAGSKYVLTVTYQYLTEETLDIGIVVNPYWYQTTKFYIAISVLATVLLTGIFIAITLLRLKRAKENEQKNYQQLLSVQAQLNPHFIFNALSSIQSLINTGNIESANHYLGEFSDLLRSALKNSAIVHVPLTLELQTLETYLALEKLRFCFTWHTTVDDSLDVSAITIPNLLLQPLVENAIKHGIGQLGNKGILLIRVSALPSGFEVKISDNGPGFTEGKEEGYGIRLTRNRIQLINKLEKGRNIRLTFEHDGEGMHVLYSFINWLT